MRPNTGLLKFQSIITTNISLSNSTNFPHVIKWVFVFVHSDVCAYNRLQEGIFNLFFPDAEMQICPEFFIIFIFLCFACLTERLKGLVRTLR